MSSCPKEQSRFLPKIPCHIPSAEEKEIIPSLGAIVRRQDPGPAKRPQRAERHDDHLSNQPIVEVGPLLLRVTAVVHGPRGSQHRDNLQLRARLIVCCTACVRQWPATSIPWRSGSGTMLSGS